MFWPTCWHLQRLLAAVLLLVWSVAHCRLFCQRLHSHLLQLVDAVSTQAPAGCVAAAVSGEVSQAKRLKTLTGGPAQRQVGMVGPMHNGGMHGVQHSSELCLAWHQWLVILHTTVSVLLLTVFSASSATVAECAC